jgi:hypothetical protein
MSYYYKYNFVSPAPIYAIIKEELKSYFDTGVVDDLMFPTYLSKCLQKLSKTTLAIDEVPLFIEDFQARLPDNFSSAREIWMCVELDLRPYQEPSSMYTQSGTSIVQISPVIYGAQTCTNNRNPNTNVCDDDTCTACVPVYTHIPHTSDAVYKVNETISRKYKQLFMLKPGNVSANKNCSLDYNKNWSSYGQTPGSSQLNSFDVRDNKLITNFRQGLVHMIYYAEEMDCNQNQLIPDNYRIKEYIEAFIKYKLFETMTNQINDETFQQLQQKLIYYKQLSDEAYILADIEVKKQTVEQKISRIKKDMTRFTKYEKGIYGAYNRRLFNRNNQ